MKTIFSSNSFLPTCLVKDQDIAIVLVEAAPGE